MFLGKWYVEKRTAVLLGICAGLALVAGVVLGLPAALNALGGSAASEPVAVQNIPQNAEANQPEVPGGPGTDTPLPGAGSADPSGTPLVSNSEGSGGGSPSPASSPVPSPSGSGAETVTAQGPGGVPVPIPSGSPTWLSNPPLSEASLPPELSEIAVPVSDDPRTTAQSTAAIIWGQAVLIATKSGAVVADSISDALIEEAAKKLSSTVAVWEQAGNRVTVQLPNGTASWHVCPTTGPQESPCGLP